MTEVRVLTPEEIALLRAELVEVTPPSESHWSAPRIVATLEQLTAERDDARAATAHYRQLYEATLRELNRTGKRIPLSTEALIDARDSALAALRELVIGLEALYSEESWDCFAEEIDMPYQRARAVLGSPVVMLAGGYEGGHFHFLKNEGERCETCEEECDEKGS